MQTVAPAPVNDFLARLAAGTPTFQLGIRNARTTDTVRIAHSSGHHAILVDLEHSTMSIDVAAALCAAAADLGSSAFAALLEREYGLMADCLDGGAHEVSWPLGSRPPNEAATIARACRFPPRGQRSQLSAVPLSGMQPVPASVLNPRLDAATIVQIVL